MMGNTIDRKIVAGTTNFCSFILCSVAVDSFAVLGYPMPEPEKGEMNMVTKVEKG